MVKLKMSFEKLLSPDRREFVDKVYTEMVGNAYSNNTSDRESRKNFFLQSLHKRFGLIQYFNGLIIYSSFLQLMQFSIIFIVSSNFVD